MELLLAGTLSYKYLGVHLDQTLNFSTHFDKIYKKATGRLNLLRRIRSAIYSASAEEIYRTMIMPALDIVVRCPSDGLHHTRKELRVLSVEALMLLHRPGLHLSAYVCLVSKQE